MYNGRRLFLLKLGVGACEVSRVQPDAKTSHVQTHLKVLGSTFESYNNMADRPPSPTPEEREKLDKDAKRREDEEQSALPYKWTQQIGDLDITSPIPSNVKGKDFDVKITKTSIKAGIKGQSPIIEVR